MTANGLPAGEITGHNFNWMHDFIGGKRKPKN
jgi:hypothetical protein